MLTRVLSRWNRLDREGTTNADAPSLHSSRPSAIRDFLVDGELRAHAGGAVELAFNHDNGDVIVETNVAAEVCRAIKDIDRQLFRRK